jgi:hypothetical protein
VAKLGEFHLLGDYLHTLVSVLKITEVAQNFGYLFSRCQLRIRQKNCLASFWATFSKTHLVTLVPWLFGVV